MEFLLSSPADTTNYMIAGYLFIFVAMSIYLVSLIVRWRNLRRAIQDLQKTDSD